MLIGQLAASVDLPPETVRFYERKNLLPKPQRASNGYRIYNESTLNRLKFIRNAQTAGLTLAEIKSIIELRDQGTTPCEHVEQLLKSKVAQIHSQQEQLEDLETELDRLIAKGRSLNPKDCTEDNVCHIL